MSKHHCHYYKTHALSESKIQFFEDAAKESIEKQHQIESGDSVSFDEFLQNYFDEE
jgi:glutamate--cysteine ligase